MSMKYIEAVTRTFSERCSDNFKKTGKNAFEYERK